MQEGKKNRTKKRWKRGNSPAEKGKGLIGLLDSSLRNAEKIKKRLRPGRGKNAKGGERATGGHLRPNWKKTAKKVNEKKMFKGVKHDFSGGNGQGKKKQGKFVQTEQKRKKEGTASRRQERRKKIAGIRVATQEPTNRRDKGPENQKIGWKLGKKKKGQAALEKGYWGAAGTVEIIGKRKISVKKQHSDSEEKIVATMGGKPTNQNKPEKKKRPEVEN